MINIEDLFISQPALCAIASIDEFRGRWQGRGGIDETLAARLKERALNESVAAIANPAENRNYRQLLEQIVNHSGEIGLFETSVKKLHKLLLADSLIDEREKANTNSVSIRFIPKPWTDGRSTFFLKPPARLKRRK